nr:ATP-dependent DNA helicase [Spelaeicoccus albus]
MLATAVKALGGERRDGQVAMAEAVADSLATGTHLLVQAGTGTGKSLAYLVPAISHAVGADEPVMISTATLALQNQIVARDLPRVIDSLKSELPRAAEVALVKGRRNYVCKHKLDGGYPEESGDTLFDFGADAAAGGAGGGAGGTSKLGKEVSRLREWAAATETGDRDEVVPGVSEKAWAQVSVNAFDCLGAAKCPVAEACFSERARAKAADADVVVTNHALLAIDSFGDAQVLPEHGAVVIDEAHELTDRVTSALAGKLTQAMVSSAASSARKHMSVNPASLERAGDDLAAALEGSVAGLLRSGPDEALGLALTTVRDAARSALTASQSESKETADPGRQVARARLQEIFDLAERILSGAEDDVLWIERSTFRDAETVSVQVAPLSVAGRLRSGLFGQRTVIATSATLTLGGSFNPLAGSFGLIGDDAPKWQGLDVGSPFDYPRQGILYTAKHLAPPSRGGAADDMFRELEELIAAAGGGTLGLFSSRRAAEAAAEEMRRRLDFPVMCQGDDITPTLVKRFAASRSACLFGTLSLWQGVDVPGQNCRLVVIDRLPFPRPDDPLSSARSADVAARGGNGFMSVSATHAAIRLAQGAGRLIRTPSDRGVVAVLDSRLATARYGGYLRASLPPLWPTTNGELVRGALRRLDAADTEPAG